MTSLFVLAGLVWIPILLFQISRRGFLVLLIWLAMAPVVVDLMGSGSRIFQGSNVGYAGRASGGVNLETASQDLTLKEILRQPTRFIIAAFLLVFVGHSVIKRTRSFSVDRTEVWMIIFCIIFLGNIFFLSNRFFYSIRFAVDSFIIPFLAYSLTKRLVLDEDRFRQLTKILGYLGVCLISLGLLERVLHEGLTYRLYGPFRSGTAYYYVMVVVFISTLLDQVCSKYPRKEKQSIPGRIRLFVTCLVPIIVLLTWSRGNWAGFMAASWVFAFMGWRVIGQTRRIGAIGIGLSVIAVLIVVILIVAPESAFERRLTNQDTLAWRVDRWAIALEAAFQRPFLGIGINNLRDIFGLELGNFYSAHSQFLTFFAELGFLGLGLYLAVMLSIIRTGINLYQKGRYPADQWRGIAVVSLIAGQIVPGLFADTIQAAGLWLFYQYVFLGGVAGLYTHRKAVGEFNSGSAMSGFGAETRLLCEVK